jgi:hypothetical protein
MLHICAGVRQRSGGSGTGERFYGYRFVIANVENRVELGDLQDVVNFIVQLEELQFALLLADGDEGADELAKARTVDVTDMSKVEKNLLMAVFQKIGNEIPQGGACFTENNAAGYVYDSDVAYLSSGGAKVHGNLHFRPQKPNRDT